MRLYNTLKKAILTPFEEQGGLGYAIPLRRGVSSKSELDLLDNSYEWQITYKFPARPHGINEYETTSYSCRSLYEMLCDMYCGGEYFVDTYLNNVYPFTIKGEMQHYLDRMKKDLIADYEDILFVDKGIRINKQGKLDKRHNQNKAFRVMKGLFKEFTRLTKDTYDDFGIYFADRLREDLILCMQTGAVQSFLGVHPTLKTQQQRLKTGIPPVPSLFATGELVRSCQFFVKIELKSWMNQYSNNE